MDAKEFRKAFRDGKSWKDAEDAIRALSNSQRVSLRDALKITEEYTGLDMRQEFFLGLLRAITRKNE